MVRFYDAMTKFRPSKNISINGKIARKTNVMTHTKIGRKLGTISGVQTLESGHLMSVPQKSIPSTVVIHYNALGNVH